VILDDPVSDGQAQPDDGELYDDEISAGAGLNMDAAAAFNRLRGIG
jgi:hypothetical protein